MTTKAILFLGLPVDELVVDDISRLDFEDELGVGFRLLALSEEHKCGYDVTQIKTDGGINMVGFVVESTGISEAVVLVDMQPRIEYKTKVFKKLFHDLNPRLLLMEVGIEQPEPSSVA